MRRIDRARWLVLGWTIAGFVLLALPGASQEEPSAARIALEQSIQHHDPHDVWSTQPIEVVVEVELSERLARDREWHPQRRDRMEIDLPASWYRQETQWGENRMTLEVSGDSVAATVNGSSDVDPAVLDKYRWNVGRRDFATYVYGLPMKLRDPGTRLDPEVGRVEFAGREVLRLRVTYDPEVGDDTWYFYLDPDTHALVGFRFYHDESANDGEYVVFEGTAAGPDGLRLPGRHRTWFMNRDGERIAVDEILSVARAARR